MKIGIELTTNAPSLKQMPEVPSICKTIIKDTMCGWLDFAQLHNTHRCVVQSCVFTCYTHVVHYMYVNTNFLAHCCGYPYSVAKIPSLNPPTKTTCCLKFPTLNATCNNISPN